MIKFANIEFKGVLKKDILKDDGVFKFIVTVNSEFIFRAHNDDRFKSILNNNISTFDGQVPYLIAKLKNIGINIDKISGSDVIYDFCDMAKKNNLKIFLLGGSEESNIQAVRVIQGRYNIDVAGYSPSFSPYPFKSELNVLILDEIRKFSPDVVFVGFGAVKQEFWIDEHVDALKRCGVKWVIGSGGTFDFVSGAVARAPKAIQYIGLEGGWRFLINPSMMRFKRLLISLRALKYMFL